MEEGSVKLQYPLKKESSVRILRYQEWLSLEPQVEGFALEKRGKEKSLVRKRKEVILSESKKKQWNF